LPREITTCLFLPVPYAVIWQVTDVVVTHTVDPHFVPDPLPICTVGLGSDCPKLTPFRVIDAPEQVAAFDAKVLDRTGAS